MRKFLVKSLLLFLLLIVVVGGFIIFMEKKLGAMTNSYIYKRQQLTAQADSIKVLVLGGSEALYGVNPVYFKLKGYNLSNTSQSLFYDVHITMNYLDKIPKLKYVFIEVNYFSLGYQIFDSKEQWRDYFYAQCWNIRYPELKSTDPYLYSKILLYTPEMSMAYAAKLFHSNLAKDYRPDGWAKIPRTIEIKDGDSYIMVKVHDESFVASRYQSIVSMLDTLLMTLKQRNITPVFYTLPVSASYYKYTDKSRYTIAYKTISTFCDKYHCKYYNYVNDGRFVNQDFGDCNHLDSIGSVKMSRILNNDIMVKEDTVK